ncbi:MAG: hypothetical protein QM687_06195 [Ferruginibacter sp.]
MLKELFNNKAIKAKTKVSQVGEWLLSRELHLHELLVFAETQGGTVKASCIEAMEYATRQKPAIADAKLFAFVTGALNEEAPRIKWESARVIGNIAFIFPAKLKSCIKSLVENANHEGSVVRWASAYALAAILELNTKLNTSLLPEVERLAQKETDNGVKKKYLAALKKLKK